MTTAPITQRRTVNFENTIHIIECANCSVDFGIGDQFMRRRREDHAVFYCPNGHSNYYTDNNEAEKAQAEVARLRRVVKSEREYAEAERVRRRTAERQRAAAKGQLTKMKNRIAKGVCPCCQRSFTDVHRHMATEHPEFVAEHDLGAGFVTADDEGGA